MLDVMDDHGMARTSDVIAAAEWIYQNKDTARHPRRELLAPLGHAEQLHQGPARPGRGEAVVRRCRRRGRLGQLRRPERAERGQVRAGQRSVRDHGRRDRPRGQRQALQARRPELVGLRLHLRRLPKPEVSAAGRYMVGPVPAGATLKADKPDNVLSSTSMRLSGTSFVVADRGGRGGPDPGAEPELDARQVKGALMVTARHVPDAEPGQAGVGEINAERALELRPHPQPERGPEQVRPQDLVRLGIRDVRFDAACWESSAKANVSWDSASWSDASWSDASWNSASWQSVSWSDASWQTRRPGRTSPGATCSPWQTSAGRTMPATTPRLPGATT